MLHRLPIPVVVQFKLLEYVRSLAGIVGLKPVGKGGVEALLLWVFCFVRQSSVLLAYHSCRGVLPSVVCV